MSQGIVGAFSCVLTIFSSSCFGAETFEEVLQEIEANAPKISSWSADLLMRTTVAGMQMDYTGELAGKGQATAMTARMLAGGQTMNMKTVIDEAGVQWIETDAGGVQQIMKIDRSKLEGLEEGAGALAGFGASGMSPTQSPREMLEMYGKLYDLDVEGAESVNGVDTYVLAGTMTDDAKNTLGPSLSQVQAMGASMDWVELAVGQKDGFVRRVRMGSPDSPFLTIDFKNVKINPSLNADRFTYEPPEGAHVMDMTATVQQTLDNQQPSVSVETGDQN